MTGYNGEGILIEGSYSVNIRDCNIHHNGGGGGDGDGIAIWGDSEQIYVINCFIHDNADAIGGDGIEIADGSDTIWVMNTNCSNNGDAGVKINGDNTDSNHVINCSFWDNNNGVEIYRGKYNEIRNCEMASNVVDGIILGTTGVVVDDTYSNTITNCIVHDNLDDGIQLEKAYKNTISYCEIYNNGNAVNKVGIYCFKSGRSGEANYIKYCNIYNNYDDGIRLRSSDYNDINYCNVFDNGNDGLELSGYQAIDSCHNQILKCNFYCNSGAGVYIASGSIANTIINCNFEAQKGCEMQCTPFMQ
jgi:parallel beta-helix repeat protein